MSIETQEKKAEKKNRNQCHSTHLHYFRCHHDRFVLQGGPSSRCFTTRGCHQTQSLWVGGGACVAVLRRAVDIRVACNYIRVPNRSKTVRQRKSLMSSRRPTIWHNSRRHLKNHLIKFACMLKQTFSAAFPRLCMGHPWSCLHLADPETVRMQPSHLCSESRSSTC